MLSASKENIFSVIDLTDIKGILVDIDNTLYSYEPAHRNALKACFQTFSEEDIEKTLSLESFSINYRDKRTKVTERLHPQGSCRSRLLTFQLLFEELKIHDSYKKALEYESIYWNAFIDKMTLRKDISNFLIESKNNGLSICAITDMQTNFQILKLQKLGMDQVIDFLVTSEEVGVEKPHPKIFNVALHKLNLKANEVIMIGDSPDKDIEGAGNIGIRAYLLEP